jgi:hypothetical protein
MRIAAALTVALSAVMASGQVLKADVKADERGLVKFEGTLGQVVGIFGGKAARDGVRSTVAVKGNRKISVNESTGQIVDLDEQKVYELDMRGKSYRVTTFEELRRRMEEARRKAEENARQAQGDNAAPPDQSGKEIEVDFNVKETGQRKSMNGFDTRQVVMTIAFREKGRTIEDSGGLIVTADSWIAPRIEAMGEIAEFDLRYAQQLQGPMVVGASAEQMAAALAVYPMLRDGLARLRAESVKLEGTPILTTTTIESVKSAEQLAQEKAKSDGGTPSVSGGVGGLLGGLARRAARREEPTPRAVFMTLTSEVLKVTTDVAPADVAVPAGFRERQ